MKWMIFVAILCSAASADLISADSHSHDSVPSAEVYYAASTPCENKKATAATGGGVSISGEDDDGACAVPPQPGAKCTKRWTYTPRSGQKCEESTGRCCLDYDSAPFYCEWKCIGTQCNKGDKVVTGPLETSLQTVDCDGEGSCGQPTAPLDDCPNT